jgi:cellulose biosynthesis protein BcsQ
MIEKNDKEIISFFSNKGGDGCSSFLLGTALSLAENKKVLIIDFCGDIPAMLGYERDSAYGIIDWFNSNGASGVDPLQGMAITFSENLLVLPKGNSGFNESINSVDFQEVVNCFDADYIFIDAGVNEMLWDSFLLKDFNYRCVFSSNYFSLRKLLNKLTYRDLKNFVFIYNAKSSITLAKISDMFANQKILELKFSSTIGKMFEAGIIAQRAPISFLENCMAAHNGFEKRG